MKRRKFLSLAAVVVLTAAFAPPAPAPSFVGRHLSAARTHQAANRLDEARAEYLKVLERDMGNLPAMSGLIEVSALRGDRDEEIYTLHRFVEKASRVSRLPAELKKNLGEYRRALAGRDPRTGKVGSYRAAYLRRLLGLGVAHLKKGRFHQALAIFNEVAHLDPDSEEAREAFDRIRTEGGNELADATVSGERELFADVTREWVEKQNARHNTWESAWKKKTENHTVITDAGYDVLEITALSLEQLNRFFRKFYRYKEKGGGTAHIQVRIYKDRDEYTLLGKPSVPWSGGYYNGSAIVTYDPRGSQNANDGRSSLEPSRSLNGLIQTLAHELSHHFTNIAPGTGVPAWLNEGMASFMEGTQLRSNGQVEWNLVAPHRLMPLVEYLDSPNPPDLAGIISCDVEDYRIFYPYGWGIVFFLYNFEDDQGNYAYRDILHRYRSTYVGGVDHLQRFMEEIIEKPKREGIETLEDFEILLSGFIHQVKTEYLGKAEVARQYEARSDALVEKEDFEKAKLFLEKAQKKLEDDPNILWKLARVLEELGENDRAAGTYRRFLNASEFHGIGDDPRLEEARSRIEELDPLAGRFTKIREQFEEDVLSVARGYREDKLFLMALGTARELAVADNPSLAARDFYLDVEEESGRTLEQWQVVFNETDLVGWTGEDITGQFRVEGEKLVGVVTDADVKDSRKGPATGGKLAKKEKTIPYKIFFLDRDVRGDYSFDAEVRAPAGCDLYGICFGARTKDNFKAILLKSDGNLDISSFDGAWTIKRHIPTYVDSSEWSRLRVDIRGNVLKVSLAGTLLEELEFDNPADLRGQLGILVGRGRAEYRNLRYLERNWRLPYRRIKREFRSDFSGTLKVTRAVPGSVYYRGKCPPPLTTLCWRDREPVTLDELLGKVVVLAFWSTYQESALPTIPMYQALLERIAGLDVELLVVTNDKPKDLDAYLKDRIMPFGLAVDYRDRTFKAYAIPEVGMPHIKLLGLDGRVVWEGNPDWSKKHGSYLDEPLKELTKSLRLAEIARLRKDFPRVEKAITAGRYSEAFRLYSKFDGMNPDHPDVRSALGELQRLRDAAGALFTLASERAGGGNRLGAIDLFRLVETEFSACPEAARARQEIAALDKVKLYKDSLWIEHRIVSALEAHAHGEPDPFMGRLEKVRDRLERVLSNGGAGIRSVEYRLILDRLSIGAGAVVSLADELIRTRALRADIERVERQAAVMRFTEARRLCAELLVAAKGTPFEKKAEELFERLEG